MAEAAVVGPKPSTLMMTPGQAIASCEQALRQLLAFRLQDSLGQDWLTRVATDERITKWQTRRTDEEARRRRRGVASVSQDPLAYADLFEIRDIIEKQWRHLDNALGKKADTAPLLKRLDDLRNTVAHSRELLPFEAELLSGIAGDIRNRVTIYMSAKDPVGKHYPRIESVTDSLGNSSEQAGVLATVWTELTVPFGETVRFVCRATDPQGRELSWTLDTSAGTRDEAVGNDVELTWVVDQDIEVAESCRVTIEMKSNGKYHRHTEVDEDVTFIYRVDPPDEV